jgi:hypothetical protein
VDIKRTLWSFGEAAGGPTLKNMVRYQPRPASLVGSTKPPSVITVEKLVVMVSIIASQVQLCLGYLVEPYVIPEVGIVIKNIVPTVCGPSAINVAPKDVGDAVLDLFSDFDQVHILPASCRTLDLIVTGFSM